MPITRPEDMAIIKEQDLFQIRCPEFDIGSFGINVSEVFTLLWKLFNECFGEGIRSRYRGTYGDMETEVLWEYEGWILQIKEEYEHPKTGGIHLRMKIY